MCKSCDKFWSDLGGWLTHPLYGDIDPLDIILTTALVAISVIILLDVNSILKAKVS